MDTKNISCVHACAALSRVNKLPKDFCHHLLTMESYRKHIIIILIQFLDNHYGIMQKNENLKNYR
ncbi:hypothetical protein Ahy_A02g008213 isoform B [Arachis hypogaea]|uniref:Uncharacterized protein n=1 Tax=Arachis hypogaea TaxID=3818 RepID=A0A445EE57_ARAHY|nr:hypothetical protein Ahy_A02g008213 isoform B [Arachis hypogaea]